MSVALSGPFLSMLSANSSAFFSVVSNWSLQRESHTVSSCFFSQVCTSDGVTAPHRQAVRGKPGLMYTICTHSWDYRYEKDKSLTWRPQ